MSNTSNSEIETDEQLLTRLVSAELCAIPIAQWQHFFPCDVAVWRFIEIKRPGLLGELDAGFDSEPWFAGRGSEWFYGTLGNREEYMVLLEQIMYPLVSRLPDSANERGFLKIEELPPLGMDTIGALARLVLEEADNAEATGAIT